MPDAFKPKTRMQSASLASPAATRSGYIVEDDPDVRNLTVRSIIGLGYCAVDAADVASARSVMSENSKIDLVLLDVVLSGGLSGVDFANELRVTHPGLPVIFVSGYPQDKLELDKLTGTRAAFMTKPFQRSELAATLSAILKST